MKQNTIVVFFNFQWNWPADYARQTAVQLSRTNSVICFLGIEPYSIPDVLFLKKKLFSQINKKIWTYHPIYFPLRRFKPVEQFQIFCNVIILELLNLYNFRTKSKLIAWIFDQMYAPYVAWMPSRWFVMYDCLDFIWHQDNFVKKRMIVFEKELINNATWMTVNSHALYDIHKTSRKDIYHVPLGFDEDSFKVLRNKSRLLPRHKKPKIGFVGVVDQRIDFTLVTQLMAHNPEWDFVLWGPVYFDGMSKENIAEYSKLVTLPNVICGRSEGRSELPSIINQFDVCVIPYRIDISFNVYSFPMKIFEYFYFAKPVVSTPIRELRRYSSYIRFGKTMQQWEGHIKKLLRTPWSDTKKHQQRSLAIANSWSSKIDRMRMIINRSL